MKSPNTYLNKAWQYVKCFPKKYWARNWWNKVKVIVLVIVLLFFGTAYGIARWYISTQSSIPLTMGVSFIPDYAQFLGVNPEQTMKSLLDIGVRNFRLVSYWTDIEPTKGSYNFSQLNWEFKLADEYHAHVLLVVGLRQPDWPECHMPAWAQKEPVSVWQPQLESVMAKVINKYKNNPALSAYQVENEYYLKAFGDCTNFSPARLKSEYDLVKRLDPSKPAIISRSNNVFGAAISPPIANAYGLSVYRRVWDAKVTHHYLTLPYPAWYYSYLAGSMRIFDHRNLFIAEFQAEPWAPNEKTLKQTSLSQQNKTMSPAMFKSQFQFAENTGIKTIYMWGAEYWYYRMEVEHDPSLWNIAKQYFTTHQAAQDVPDFTN